MCAWNKAVQWSLYPMDSGWEIRTHIFSWMYMCCVSLFSRFSLPCISYWSKAGHTILLSFFITTLLIFNRGDGSCKHVVALLFGIIDHITSMEDRSSIGVTDTAAYWDKPRKVCRPVPVHDLDIRCVTLFLYVLFLGLPSNWINLFYKHCQFNCSFLALLACTCIVLIYSVLILCQSFYSFENQANLAEWITKLNCLISFN